MKVSGYTGDKSLDASGDRPDEILEYVRLNSINRPWIAIDDMSMLDMNSTLKEINFYDSILKRGR